MKRKYQFKIIVTFYFTLVLTAFSQAEKMPEEFGYLQEEHPSIEIELRYVGRNNFMGTPVEGYHKAKLILTKRAIEKLALVQEELKKENLSLKIFDGYRPQRAVDHFVRWAKDEKDTLMKSIYYPDVAKSQLFEKGYIAEKSGHSRGSTVDVTLVDIASGRELDMGSPYDFFGKISWPFAVHVTENQKRNRMLLRTVMLNNGFKPYQCEWWHFTLKEEPFPETYFNFPIE